MKTAEKKKKTDWQTVAIAGLMLISVAVVVCTLTSIWLEDWRWFATAVVLFAVDFLGFFAATEMFE